MKKVQFLTMLFFSMQLSAQEIPSSVSLKSFTYSRVTPLGVSESFIAEPSFYVVYEGIYYPNVDTVIEQPIDKVMTYSDVVNYMYNLVYRAENGNWMDEARMMTRNKLKGLVSSINSILTQLSGKTYFQMSEDKYSYAYKGVWSAEYSDTVEYFMLSDSGQVFECDIFGDEISGGKKGTYDIYTENRFKISNYFPQELVPYTTVFNKELNSDNYSFFDANIKLKKQ